MEMLWTIATAACALKRGELSPLALLDTCLERIERYEPRIQAWVFVDREYARHQAETLAAELRQGRWRGPLHGIPIGIKDIFDVYDWPTAAGSQLWAKSIARQDAPVVRRLRQAGAILLGKTVTTQYASFDPPPTRNPWNTARTPGGSSSGSAAAVACGMCLGALGSQTGGSITRPASYCGVAGCKPTFGRVCTAGVVPLATSMDHVGPIAACVRDLAILLQTIAGPDPHDPDCPERAVPDYLARCSQTHPAPRLGRLRGLFEDLAEPTMQKLLDHVAMQLRSQGAAITDVALPAGFAEVVSSHRTVMAVEAAAYHGPRLRRHPEDYAPKIRSLLEEGLACSAPEYARCKELQRRLSREILACFQGVDAFLAPATTGPAPDAATTGDPAFNSPWSFTGLPAVSLPAGRDPDGMPLAIQLIGRPWEEAGLLAAAAWCEKVAEYVRASPPDTGETAVPHH
jgi:Asp-tRNA(Asn)/Glu-tRNA(Gln) amidotransferase A subunit family amidase